MIGNDFPGMPSGMGFGGLPFGLPLGTHPWQPWGGPPAPAEGLEAQLRLFDPARYAALTEHCVVEHWDVPVARAQSWSGKAGGYGHGVAATNKGALYRWVRTGD